MKKSKWNEKKWKKAKKSEKKRKKRKIDLNFALLCFASKKKLLNRSEAKNLKRKKAKKCEKNAKKCENKRKEAKKEKWNFIVK